MAALLLLLTSCSSGGQVMDGDGMVRSYTQISQKEAKPDNLEGTVPASADALVGEFDFSAEKVLLMSIGDRKGNSMKQYIVDAFTDKPFSGNPAAVCVMDSCGEVKQDWEADASSKAPASF